MPSPSLRGIRLLLPLAIGLLAFPATAHATNYIYTGLAATCPFPAEQCGDFVPGNPAAWGDHRNWSPQGVPGPGDTAIISGNSSVNLGGSRTVARLNLNNGSQFGTGLEGGTITITGAAPTFISSWTTGNFACNVNIGAGAQLNIAGSTGRSIVGGTVNNSGTINWSGTGAISCVNSPTFNNQAGGVFNVSASASYAPNAGITVFNNLAGSTLNHTGGATTLFNFVTFNNHGTVNGVAGTLDFVGGLGNSSGNFTAADGARVNVTGGLAGTLDPSGSGIIGITDAVFNSGLKCIGTGICRIFSGTVSVNGMATVGEPGGQGTLEIAPFLFSAVVVTGTPSGSLHCAGSGFIDWKGGNIGQNAGGVVNLGNSCVLRISADTNKNIVGDTINNSGIVNWTGEGGVNCVNSPTFNNLSGGTFNAQNSADWRPNSGTTVFNNHAGAVFNKSGAGTTTHFDFVDFSNAGTINVASGLLNINQSQGISSGTFNASNGARANVSGTLSGTLHAAAGGIIGLQDATLNGGTRCIGAGKCQVFSGTVSVNGTVTVGTPGGTGTLEIAPDGFNAINFTGTPTSSLACAGTGAIDWKTGVIGGVAGGTLNLSSSCVFKISTPNNHPIIGATINNGGLVNWTDGSIQADNGATFNNLNGGTFNTPAMVANYTHFNGAAPAVVNAGTLNVGGANEIGTLALNGTSLTNTVSGVLGMEIGGPLPGTEHDRLNTNVNATLAGTLQLGFIDGFHPNGESFTVMTYPSHTGDFNTINGLNVGGGRILSASANPTDYVIADLNAVVTTRTVSGRVTNNSGVGVANIKLKRSNSTSTVTTDAAGNYTFENVTLGTVIVSPDQPGYNFSPTSRTFNVAGSNVTGINFTATVATFTISGRVINHNGAGIPNVLVARNGGASVATDSNGNFVMTGVTIGNYHIAPVITPSLNGVTFNPGAYNVNVTTSNLSNLVFTASFTVTGRVTNHSGVGIPNVQVQRVAGASVVSAFTDSNGNFTFTGVRSGSYTLSPVLTPAMAGTSFTPTSRNLVVDRNNVTNQNFIGMFSVSGVIKTSGGTAVPNVLVRLSNGSTSTTVLTDAAGNYTFANVRSGTYSITPTLSGRTFSPVARNGVVVSTLSITNQNFTASG